GGRGRAAPDSGGGNALGRFFRGDVRGDGGRGVGGVCRGRGGRSGRRGTRRCARWGGGRGCVGGGRGGARRAGGTGGRQLQVDGQRHAGEFLAEFLDAAQITLAYPLQYEAVGCDQGQRRILSGLRTQGLDPGVELLLGQLLFKARQAEGPEILSHGVGGR